MGARFDLLAVGIANAMGFVLLLIIFISNRWRLEKSSLENRLLMTIILVAIVSCVADPLSCVCDEVPGFLCWLGNWVCNWWLYFTNLIVVPCWIIFLSLHLTYGVSKFNKWALIVLDAIGALLIVANIFTPVMFFVDDGNVYHRGPGYWYLIAMQCFMVVDSLVLYFKAKASGGLLKFFPIWAFSIPLILGVSLQSIFFGISTIWPFVAISLGCVFASLQNELIFADSLTGLYNRYYLDYAKSGVSRFFNNKITAIMLDLNGFKSINDTYGHLTGDQALIDVAKILKRATGTKGSVVRYAGDEFIILLNTQDDALVAELRSQIEKGFAERNHAGKEGYELSASVGILKVDLNETSVDELLNAVDQRMFEDKRRYYSETGFDRRSDCRNRP